jgi:hypothetical protein
MDIAADKRIIGWRINKVSKNSQLPDALVIGDYAADMCLQHNFHAGNRDGVNKTTGQPFMKKLI